MLLSASTGSVYSYAGSVGVTDANRRIYQVNGVSLREWKSILSVRNDC